MKAALFTVRTVTLPCRCVRMSLTINLYFIQRGHKESTKLIATDVIAVCNILYFILYAYKLLLCGKPCNVYTISAYASLLVFVGFNGTRI